MQRWLMLALGTAAQTAGCLFIYGIPYLAPQLRASSPMTLTQVGLLVACPTAGLVLALVAWGAAADRYGERIVIASGLALAALALTAALPADRGPVALGALLVAGGAGAASVSAASGRLVLGWFAAHERGFAMGLRQASTPMGMGAAALAVPPLAARWGVQGAVAFFACACGLTAVVVAVGVTDPPRPTDRGAPTTRPASRPVASPFRQPALWRVHGASALLVVPQFTVGAFALVFLVDVRHWEAVSAGQFLAGAQAIGALTRIASGHWSDRMGSRVRPMRWLALANTAVMALLAAGAARPGTASDIALVLACGITMSTNGLAFTATAELAGPASAGRALGLLNTGQFLSAAATPPLVGALITATGYAQAYALAAGFACAAAFVVPARVSGDDAGTVAPARKRRVRA